MESVRQALINAIALSKSIGLGKLAAGGGGQTCG
jgi:hypothetical protein